MLTSAQNFVTNTEDMRNGSIKIQEVFWKEEKFGSKI